MTEIGEESLSTNVKGSDARNRCAWSKCQIMVDCYYRLINEIAVHSTKECLIRSRIMKHDSIAIRHASRCVTQRRLESGAVRGQSVPSQECLPCYHSHKNKPQKIPFRGYTHSKLVAQCIGFGNEVDSTSFAARRPPWSPCGYVHDLAPVPRASFVFTHT